MLVPSADTLSRGLPCGFTTDLREVAGEKNTPQARQNSKKFSSSHEMMLFFT